MRKSLFAFFFLLITPFVYAYEIPQKIWQTYKTRNLPSPARKAQISWINLNSDFDYSFWDDEGIEKYIACQWDDRTLSFFKSFPLGVMKADLWRYLIIADMGGVYSDIDSICHTPIRLWGADVPNHSTNVLLLGLENDIHFCQWTIAASAKHPAMIHVCKYVVQNWVNNGIDIKNPHFVHATTGPAIWTEAICDYLGVHCKTAKEIYSLYVCDSNFREHINSLGVWLYSENNYKGMWSSNLYGSQFFGDNYIKWIDERDKILRNLPQ
ncbi:MAG: hypothetical protein KGI80_02725 [Verrucomicrobiota bacterium]|nr:hypothetical protein [Verrucomicrobiota bacterium]